MLKFGSMVIPGVGVVLGNGVTSAGPALPRSGSAGAPPRGGGGCPAAGAAGRACGITGSDPLRVFDPNWLQYSTLLESDNYSDY